MPATLERSILLAVVVGVAGSLLGGPAAADWLMTHDGSAIETRDAWEVRGRLVVFHTPKGALVSMRLSEVDLEASTARTEAAKRAAQAPAPKPVEPVAKPKARFVLTDADVEHVDPASVPDLSRSTSAADSEDAGDGESAPRATTGREVVLEENPLEVASWNAVLGPGADGVVISGVVKNPSEYFASGISIAVSVLDLLGEEVGSGAASMKVNALGPGERGAFEAKFPGVFTVSKALFEIESFNAVAAESP